MYMSKTKISSSMHHAEGVKKKVKKSLLYTIGLDGFLELSRSKRGWESIGWFTFIIVTYSCSVVLSFLTAQRYGIGRTVVSVEDRATDTSGRIRFPKVVICIYPGWSETYLRRNIRFSHEHLEKAAARNLTPDQLYVHTSRYLNYFSPLASGYEPSEETLSLLDEIFEYMFREVEFADFVSDSGFRGEKIIVKCAFGGRKYACRPVPLVMDTPSCYLLPVLTPARTTTFEGFGISATDTSSLDIEIRIPIADILREEDDDVSSFGLQLSLGTVSPFSQVIAIPINTHATVVYRDLTQKFITNCIHDGWEQKMAVFDYYYSYEACLIASVQNETMEMCGCYFIGGGFFPRNPMVCTPRMVRTCMQPRVSYPIESPLINITKSRASLRTCKRFCFDEETTAATASFQDLESSSSKSVDYMITRLTIKSDVDRVIYQEERVLSTLYQLFSDVGGLVGVYTGVSIALAVRALILVLVESSSEINRMMRPILAKLHRPTPISIQYYEEAGLIFWRRWNAPRLRYHRVGTSRTNVIVVGGRIAS